MTQDTKTDLMPCPFCGAEVNLIGSYARGYAVSCQCRNLETAGKEEVIEAWNNRVSNAADECYDALKIIASGGEGQYQWSMTKAENIAKAAIATHYTRSDARPDGCWEALKTAYGLIKQSGMIAGDGVIENIERELAKTETRGDESVRAALEYLLRRYWEDVCQRISIEEFDKEDAVIKAREALEGVG